jgi:hypothetical protein
VGVKSEKQKTAITAETGIREVLKGLELHIGKIGEYDNETIKKALIEDLRQLQSLLR